MKLYIAEKPSLGRAIAEALPKPHKKHQGYIEVANGDVVSWCIGHVLEQANPDAYDEKYKKWQMQHLPIIPDTWQLKPKTQTRSQLTLLKKLLKQCSSIVHAGDPDREGQLLVDEVIDYLKVPVAKKSTVQRLLINDLNLAAVKRALQSLQANKDFIPLSISALARSRADWLYGINLTRAYTISGQKNGYNGVLSVGRVQTPLLGLVVERDISIANFISKPFYEVLAHIKDTNGETFTAKWQPSEACSPYMDEDKHLLVKALAENVISRIANQKAIVKDINSQEKKQFSPLPYNLSALQIDAAKAFSMNAKLVLDVCQGLYEKHKLITYPRSDCRYLPMDHFSQAPQITKMLSTSELGFKQFAQNVNTSIKSKAFNNSKVSAHHAIIPTEKSANNINLNSFEKNIYGLIVKQYLIQFYPPYIFEQTKLALDIAGGLFTVNCKSPKDIGWKTVFQKKQKHISTLTPNNYEKKLEHEHLAQNTDQHLEKQTLPNLKQGDILLCTHGELLEKTTQPPQSFTDASLLTAMTGISRYVDDKSIKKTLKDTDGLGTEATRANIIELLFKRGFLERIGKQIKATVVGKSLINALPDLATKPDMTAQWEATLNAMSNKQSSYQSFMLPLEGIIHSMVADAHLQDFSQLPKVAFKAKPKNKSRNNYKKTAIKSSKTSKKAKSIKPVTHM